MQAHTMVGPGIVVITVAPPPLRLRPPAARRCARRRRFRTNRIRAQLGPRRDLLPGTGDRLQGTVTGIARLMSVRQGDTAENCCGLPVDLPMMPRSGAVGDPPRILDGPEKI